MFCHGHRNAARTGAKIENSRSCDTFHRIENFHDESLGIGSRDQDIAGHLKTQTKKLTLTDELFQPAAFAAGVCPSSTMLPLTIKATLSTANSISIVTN